MEKEVYSCLKMLESLNAGVNHMWNNSFFESSDKLVLVYFNICSLLKSHLSTEEFKIIPIIKPVDLSGYNPSEKEDYLRRLLQVLVVVSDVTIAYLRSLDMDLVKELIKEKTEMKRQREELESKTKQYESLQKTFES